MSSPASPEGAPPSPEETLPDGWVLCESKSLPGRKYYFDRRSGSSLWTKPPMDPEKTPQNKARKCKKHKEQPSPSKPPHREDVAKSNPHRADSDHNGSFKRKSDGSSGAASKRSRQEYSGNDYQHSDTALSSTNATQQYARSTPSSSRDFAPKYGCSKNSASKRMENLRSQLHKDEEPAESSSPHGSGSSTHHHDQHRRNQDFVSPKPEHSARDGHRSSPSERQAQSKEAKAATNFQNKAYIPKNSIKEALSPSSSEFTASNASTHQGSNDSLEIISCPSQFFEANKIICSLKAQLPEGGQRHESDTFATIEEGINAHNIEYSSKNHPATPPHFVQASRIVSSIKSRLAENISDCERKPRFRMPANDRLTALRTCLQDTVDCVKHNKNFQSQPRVSPKPLLFENKINAPKPVDNVQLQNAHNPVANHNNQTAEDSAEVQETRERRERRTSDNNTSCTVTSGSHPADRAVLVVDTNIFIHDLQFLKTVLDSYISGYKERPTLIVPWQVINELDRLKDNINGNMSVCSKAKIATDYLYQVLPSNNRIKGQTLRDAGSHIYRCDLPDDEILNCCLQQSQRGNAVILLTSDKNLCTRATINGVRALGTRDLRELLRAEPERDAADPRGCIKYYESCIYQLLSSILENEMRARYDTLWQHVLFKAPPWSLLDVLQSLLKHWVAVFSEVFPRIEPLIQQLKQQLTRIYDRGARVSPTEIVSFKDAARELACKCQIIPEYMELARLTAERLGGGAGSGGSPVPPAPTADDEKTVVDAFESIWTAFSSYCARLASMLGVPHQLDDRRENLESADSLRKKWPEFSNHIQSMAYALKRTLTANENSGIEPLLLTMSECLACIGGNRNSIDNDSLRTFCLNNRNMIHEALVKFTQLTELLAQCRSAFST